jgi:hypothetical protein
MPQEGSNLSRCKPLFRVQNSRKGLNLEGFDLSQHMIDPGLRWIYAGIYKSNRYEFEKWFPTSRLIQAVLKGAHLKNEHKFLSNAHLKVQQLVEFSLILVIRFVKVGNQIFQDCIQRMRCSSRQNNLSILYLS